MGPQQSVPTLFFHKPCFFIGCSFSGSHRSYCRRNICTLLGREMPWKVLIVKGKVKIWIRAWATAVWAPRKLNRRGRRISRALTPSPAWQRAKAGHLNKASPYLQHMLFPKASWRMIGVHMCHHGLKSDVLLRYVGIWESYLYNRRSWNWRHLRRQFIPLSEHVD